jgi:hypothetical protein
MYMILEAYTTWKLLTEHAPSRTRALSQKQPEPSNGINGKMVC